MRCVVHLGLHKTGSTWLQATANENHAVFLSNGVYYDPQDGYPAHHEMAAEFLAAHFELLRQMVERGLASGAQTLLVSSENLEGLLFRPWLAKQLVEILRPMGVKEIAFVAIIRRQDELFWSNFSELSKHLYVDAYQLFFDAMRLGYVFVERPKPIPGRTENPPYWYFSYDHRKMFNWFVSLAVPLNSGISLRVYDYDDPLGFPEQRFWSELGIESSSITAVDANFRNKRLDAVDVQSNFRKIFASAMTPGNRQSVLEMMIESRSYVGETHRQLMSDMLCERFLWGNAELIRTYGGSGPLFPSDADFGTVKSPA